MSCFKDASFEFLRGVARNFELLPLSEDQQVLIQTLDQKLPLEWMAQCTQYLREAGPKNLVNRYAEDSHLSHDIDQEHIRPKEQRLLNDLTSAICELPRPHRNFNAFRVMKHETGLEQGSAFKIRIPMDCSVNPAIITDLYQKDLKHGQHNNKSKFYAVDIVIPHEAAVGYHANMGRVILPIGAEIVVFKSEFTKTWYVGDTPFEIPTMRWIYVGLK